MTTAPVDALDRAGDGLATLDGQRRSIPFALPGDDVRQDGDTLTLLSRSPHRVPPPCPLFDRCGGCRMLHADDALYAEWKVGLLRDAFAAAGLSPPIAPMARSPLPSRRRMTLSATAGSGPPRAGYFARASHTIVDVPDCPALEPALDAALPALRAIALDAARKAGEARLVATLCDNGVDVALAAAPRAPTPRRRRKRGARTPPPPPPPMLTDPAIVRLSEGGETLIAREMPTVTLGGVPVPFPPGAFIQATRQGEKALVEAVLAGVGGAATVLDAFCGLGTFALPLSRTAAVEAVDSDGPAIAALAEAARHLKGRRPLEPVRRDLMRHPLNAGELDRFEAVVFDPPRAGARGLAEALAASRVPVVVAVSCEPRTLARDCAILTAGGYQITQVQPVDQFVATAHIEAVAWLRRHG